MEKNDTFNFDKVLINGVEKSINIQYDSFTDGKKGIIIYNSEKQIEIDVSFIINSRVKVHVRDHLIEFFLNGEKILEMEISSNSFVWANIENSKLIIRFSGKKISADLLCREKNFLIKGNRLPFGMEQVYRCHRDVRYHFVKAKDSNFENQLLVVFSAISPKYTYNFNYLSTLSSYPVNQLYILDDFGDQGSYYLGKGRDQVIESSVISLILHYVSKLNITLNNITSIGSSKGGYSALYYGIKYSFGEVISLAPQTKLGNFLKDEYSNIINFISNGNDEGNIYYLNELLYRLVRENRESLPYIYLMVGTEDSHKSRHVLPFSNYLNELNIKHSLEIVEGVNHSELKFVAPEYIKRHLSKRLYNKDISKIYISNITFNQIGNNLSVETKAIGSGLSYAHYWYRNNELIEKQLYKSSNIANYKHTQPGRYRVRVFVKNEIGEIITHTSKSIEVI